MTVFVAVFMAVRGDRWQLTNIWGTFVNYAQHKCNYFVAKQDSACQCASTLAYSCMMHFRGNLVITLRYNMAQTRDAS